MNKKILQNISTSIQEPPVVLTTYRLRPNFKANYGAESAELLALSALRCSFVSPPQTLLFLSIVCDFCTYSAPVLHLHTPS